MPKKIPPLPKGGIPSHPVVSIRMSPDEKAVFKVAAQKDGKRLATWLKWLGRQRVAEQQEEPGD